MISENMPCENMPCEKYKDALIDAAAGEPLDRGLADHLEGCTPCRATLTQEQDLFTAIDDALRARVSETPRAGFLASVHTQIAHEAQKRDAQRPSGWIHMWAWAGAAAALALVVVVIAHPSGRLQQPPVTAENVKAPALPAHESPAITQSVRGSAEHSRTHQHARLDSAQPLRAQTPVANQPATVEPEVLVPPDEARAYALFVARVAGRDTMAEAVVRPAVEKAVERNAELPSVPSVDLADLQPNSLWWNDSIDESADSE
jgi:hypothetical protein